MTAPSLPRVTCLSEPVDPDDVRAGATLAQQWAKLHEAGQVIPTICPPQRRRVPRRNTAVRALSLLELPAAPLPPPELVPANGAQNGFAWHPLDNVPAPEYVPESWDGPHVGRRLIEAFGVLRQLPFSGRPREFGNSWPQHSYEWTDLFFQESADLDQKERERETRNRVRILPTANEITRMETTLAWSARYLIPIDQQEGRDRQHSVARIVQFVAWWRSAERETEWIARRLQLSPVTLRRRNRRGLDLIAAGLRRDGVRMF